MANTKLLFADGFESYGVSPDAEARMLRNWDAVGSNVDVVALNPRSGTKSLLIRSSNFQANFVHKILRDGLEEEIVIGFGLLLASTPTGSGSQGVFIFNDSGDLMAGVTPNLDNSLTVINRLGADCGTSPPVLSPGVYHHVEVRFRHAIDESGQVEVRVDGNVGPADINAGAVDMGDDQISSFKLGQYSLIVSGVDHYYDDLFVFRGDTFSGQVLFDEAGPDDDGANQDWTVNGAATAHEALDDPDFDGDTTNITAATPGDVTGVTFPDMPTDTTAIKGIYVYAVTKTSEPGDGAFRLDINGEEGDEFTLLGDYKFFGQGFIKNPDGNIDWVEADVNALLLEFVKTA